ncbi:hypothetical protein ADL25_06015 [Streptomyces sp. NRRL F-5122]|uniref:immunity protein TriTu family protein n=1 Tax=Streptomyces sp. NRRL F-5122 TaxID=1609098 RepID=UPI000740F7A8|nr:hypothetical protein [Streptomyces sp. NRRL F-5122]KUJ54383.1 hypothetical protein ADL25_06015 [Streptomyces sp. NRRL F-5122]
MTIDEPLLAALRAWAAECGESLAAEGIALHLDDSRSQWGKPSMALALDRSEILSQLTLWEGGEAELERGVIATGKVSVEHRELASVADLRRALADLVRWQREGPGAR